MNTHNAKASGISDILFRAFGEPLPAGPKVKMEADGYLPAIDIKETATEFVLYIDLPGVDEDVIDFSWCENSLVFSGDRDFDHDTEDAEEFIQLKRPYGHFSGQIEFPNPVDPDLATAKYRRGVLKVRLPKKST